MVGFSRIGLGYLQNSPVGDVRFERDNPIHLLFGASVEYTSTYGLGGRVELLSFDNDALYTQLALLYRFGGRHRSAPKLIAAVESTPVVKPSPVVPPVSAELTPLAKARLNKIASLLHCFIASLLHCFIASLLHCFSRFCRRSILMR